jgi:RNA 2',3'-cyclic 3'-phosphodiesterase
VRLFVAADVDAPSRAAMAAEQRRLRTAAERGSPLRWVRPEQLHLTLVFLGEVDDVRADEAVAAIGQPVDQPPIDLVFAGQGVFPPRGAPRALWIGLGSGDAELRALQRVLAERVARLGLPLESRPFSPHLTIGRWKASRPSDRTIVASAFHDRIVARTRVDHATLYRSRISSAGPTYTELARAILAGRG